MLDQLLTLNADQITAVDDKNVPTGEMRNVAGTAFDFRRPTPIGAHINDPDPAIQRAHGFDQNYRHQRQARHLAAGGAADRPQIGTHPGGMDDPGRAFRSIAPIMHRPSVALIKGYQIHSAVALEAQAFPNAPNIPSFPSALLRQDTDYSQTTEFRFSMMPQN